MKEGWLSLRERKGACVAVLKGDLNIYRAHQLGKLLDRIAEHGRENMVIDLSNADFVGASVIFTLVKNAHRLWRIGRNMQVSGASPEVKDVIGIVDMDHYVVLSNDYKSPAFFHSEEIRDKMDMALSTKLCTHLVSSHD